MFGKCRHKWVEVGRIFTPSEGTKFSGKGFSETFWNKMTFGFTTVELKCENCGDLNTKVFIGDLT